jgi:hypothetical protein
MLVHFALAFLSLPTFIMTGTLWIVVAFLAPTLGATFWFGFEDFSSFWASFCLLFLPHVNAIEATGHPWHLVPLRPLQELQSQLLYSSFLAPTLASERLLGLVLRIFHLFGHHFVFCFCLMSMRLSLPATLGILFHYGLFRSFKANSFALHSWPRHSRQSDF